VTPTEKVVSSRPAAPPRARQHEQQRLRALIDSVRDHAIFMLDREGRVETWSTGAEGVSGYCRHEIIGQRVQLFYSAEDRGHGLPDELLRQAAAAGRAEDEGWRVRKDGSRFWADEVVTALRDRDGGLTGYTLVMRDLTERRNAELARARAEEAIRLRDEFLSVASHELRTPLTTLQIELRGLYDQRATCADRVAKRIERSVRNADRLDALIESLLDVSRIATGKLVLRPASVDLSQLVPPVVEEMRLLAAKAGCTLSLSAVGPVCGTWDRPRLQQVLMNLLANAVKYGAGGPVTITVGTDGDDAVIEVADKGPGIREQDLARIFRRFERAVSVRHYGGLGLGLYVSREIVRAQGGTIAARNLAGGGACFTVRLPIESAHQPPAGLTS
jgi:PAS domain S-box-containing protein